MSERYRFILYTCDGDGHAESVRAHLDRSIEGNYDLEERAIHDTMRDALKDQVFSVPCLIRTSPQPRKMVIGDLSRIHDNLLVNQDGNE